jgi:DNA-binding HxlR family transcriptional regulator
MTCRMSRAKKLWMAERAIVLLVLRDDHPEPWTRTELDRELPDVEETAIGVALERLREQGVVQVDGERFSASACARHLDALDLVGI